MGSSRPSRLTPLQRDLLEAFFQRETRFFLTGDGALGGFYLGHRDTEDLGLFGTPDLDLDEAAAVPEQATDACGGTARTVRTYPGFRRLLVSRGDERCIVDLVIDRAPAVVPEKTRFGAIRVDSLRAIAANKLSALLGRGELKDLVDLRELVQAGIDLHQALEDAERKDAALEPATLAWVLDQIAIGPLAALPGGVDPAELEEFRKDLVKRLRSEAFLRVRRS